MEEVLLAGMPTASLQGCIYGDFRNKSPVAVTTHGHADWLFGTAGWLDELMRYTELVEECRGRVPELMPWDLEERLGIAPALLLLDVREPYEFEVMHIQGAVNVPRGILETACEYDYEETVPELVAAREQEIVVLCRSGNRSLLAAATMQRMGYRDVKSLKTGLRGWNDYEQPLVDARGQAVDMDDADVFLATRLRPEQVDPRRRA